MLREGFQPLRSIGEGQGPMDPLGRIMTETLIPVTAPRKNPLEQVVIGTRSRSL
jgi:hypothetical protein